MERTDPADDYAPGSVPTINVEPPASRTTTRSPAPITTTRTATRSPRPSAVNPITTTTTTSNFSRPTVPNRPSTIRLRRLPSSAAIAQNNLQAPNDNRPPSAGSGSGRRRSTSAPQRFTSTGRPQTYSPTPATVSQLPQQLEDIAEAPTLTSAGHVADTGNEAFPSLDGNEPATGLAPLPTAEPNVGRSVSGRLRSGSNALRNRLSLTSSATARPLSEQEIANAEYDARVVDMLDVVDPEVSTLNTLNNVQNSLFIPDLGSYLNRRPTYNLSRRPTGVTEQPKVPTERPENVARMPTMVEKPSIEDHDQGLQPPDTPETRRRSRADSITSTLDDHHYAVLPHATSLIDWSEADKAELEDHVRHMLHSKRSKFRRGMKGFGQYVRKPLGLFVTVYATLITLFGLAWVLFLIGWINVGGRQNYLTNVIDNVLVALFALVGDVLAPFRCVDTYHLIYIAHYHHLTWRLRKEAALPQLNDENDLPAKPAEDADLEAADEEEKWEFSILTPKQQQKLIHHQTKFSKSHTYYRPHETETHHAFPLRLLVAVVVLLDFHSIFQIALGSCTWSISYHVRPQALTATILSCSICCNIAAGITISVGDRMTRKKDVVKKMFRQALTEDAIKMVEKHKHQSEMLHDDMDPTSSHQQMTQERGQDQENEPGGEPGSQVSAQSLDPNTKPQGPSHQYSAQSLERFTTASQGQHEP